MPLTTSGLSGKLKKISSGLKKYLINWFFDRNCLRLVISGRPDEFGKKSPTM
jgi:hypothetical protein